MTITPEPALDRSIAFDLVFNVRDLGGLATLDGRKVRRGHVFRADGVNRLDGNDLEAARGLGLRTVVDLRTLGEVEGRGGFPVDRLPVDWHHLPVITAMWSETDLVPNGTAADFLRDRYLDMLREGGAAISRTVELVADAPPLLFHCAAGKDRTGVVAAVILGLLGVSHDDIAADYHLSAAAMGVFVDWLTVTYPEAMDSMTAQPAEYLEAPPEAMLQFLAEVDNAYGGMQGLAAQLGIAEPTITRLRETLLDDWPAKGAAMRRRSPWPGPLQRFHPSPGVLALSHAVWQRLTTQEHRGRDRVRFLRSHMPFGDGWRRKNAGVAPI